MRAELHEPATAHLGRVIAAIAALDPSARLRMRRQPSIDALAEGVGRIQEAAIALHRADELARALATAVEGALDPASAVDGVLDDARARAGEVDDALELAGELAREVGLALAQAGRLGLPAPVDHELLDVLDDVRALVGDLDDALALNRDLSRALARALASGYARARAPVFARELIFAITRALDSETLDAEDLADRLDDARHSYVEADLRGADMTDLVLDGLRWSPATKWPTGSAERIRSASVEVRPGVFELRRPTF